jgi:hypothetical protein
MKLRSLVIFTSIALWAIPAMAQYKEMNKVEVLAKSNSEQQMLDGLSKHLGVSSDVLKQEMTANKLNYGQLYIAHTVAKATKSDFKSLVAESQSKPWPTIMEEKNVDKKVLAADIETLEKSFKNSKNGK